MGPLGQCIRLTHGACLFRSIFTKPSGESPDEADRQWVQRGARVKNLANTVQGNLTDPTTGARVWGASSGQSGAIVSINHVLSDSDMVELQTRRDAPGPQYR